MDLEIVPKLQFKDVEIKLDGVLWSDLPVCTVIANDGEEVKATEIKAASLELNDVQIAENGSLVHISDEATRTTIVEKLGGNPIYKLKAEAFGMDSDAAKASDVINLLFSLDVAPSGM